MPLRRPVVDGMPEERPRCANCGELLKYWANDLRDGNIPSRVVHRVFVRWRGYPVDVPLFCTLRCALGFAIASYRGGYRRVPR